ncbi:MAG: hypothetical protein WBD40_17630 [Tepidisphaeraceae bacterium]
MNELALTSSRLPAPRCGHDVSIRVATMADVKFIADLQNVHYRQIGYFPTKQVEGYVATGGVLIAEDPAGAPLAHCISRDRYLKRDELGVIYQLCVVPGAQRKLIGATLLADVFARSAFGCKLYCCWCAQDIAANHFWESVGFVPVAFRAGSARKKRVHIFWQRRINSEDVTTPYWYPCNTTAGAIGEGRLVFPIPPGTHWSEVQAVALPTPALPVASDQLPANKERRKALPFPLATGNSPLATISAGALSFAPPKPAKEKAPRARDKKPRVKIDPALIAKARELRDRCMEQANDRLLLAAGNGKYDVSRTLPSALSARLSSDEARLRPEGSAAEGSRALGARVQAKPLPLLKAG